MATPNQAGTPKSGTNGRVQINGTNYPLDHWDFNAQVDLDDTTTFEDFDATATSLTYQVDVAGVYRGTGTISGYWNAGSSQYLTVYEGLLVTNMFLYVDRIANRFYSMPTARITGNQTTVDLGGGKIKWSAPFKSYGNYVRPI